jgi:hypothetical protein
VQPRHPIVSVPHLPTSHATASCVVLLHVRRIPRNSQLWWHHSRTRRVHHSGMGLVWGDRVCGTHNRAHHRNITSPPTLRGVYSVGLLRNGAVRHRRGSTVHAWTWRVPHHLVREWRRGMAHHRSRILTRWSRPLVHRYPHWLWMHVWRSMAVDHHPTRNRATLRVHHLPGSRRMTHQG